MCAIVRIVLMCDCQDQRCQSVGGLLQEQARGERGVISGAEAGAEAGPFNQDEGYWYMV